MTSQPRLSSEQLLHLLLALLVALFALLVWRLWADYRSVPPLSGGPWVEKSDMPGPRRGALNVSPEVLRPWMTFEYVNRVFGLPPEALREVLRIADPKYPKLTIASFARKAGISADAALAQVAAAIIAASDAR